MVKPVKRDHILVSFIQSTPFPTTPRLRDQKITVSRRDIISNATGCPEKFGAKAPEDWRSPRRFASVECQIETRQRLGVRRPSAAFSWA